MLTMKHVVKEFTVPGQQKQLRILNDLSFEATAGSSLAICGPSGSGKSTLLSLIAGLDKPTSGEVIVNGQNLHSKNEEALAQFRAETIGFVFQQFNLIENFDALTNISLAGEIAGLKHSRERAAHLLEQVGLAERASHYPRMLSGGEKQRIAIARALITSPKVLIADEPTGSLDPENASTVFELLLNLHKKSGSLFVLVTHDLELAQRLQTIIHIKNGSIVRPQQQ